MIRIQTENLQSADVIALLRRHLDLMFEITPPESVHALSLDGLKAADVTFWTARDGVALLSCGALKELSAEFGEVKSMHTAIEARGRGVGSMMLQFIVDEAKRRGYQRLSLETGSMKEFASARRLYERFGFAYCEPFADYMPDPNSAFMTLRIDR